MAEQVKREEAALCEDDARDRRSLVRIGLVLGAIAIFASALYALGFLLPTLEFLAVGCVVGFIMSPIVNWLEDRKVSRPVGAIIALVVIVGVVVGVLAILGPITIEQLVSLLRKVPDYLSEAEHWLTAQVQALASDGFGGIEQNIQALVDYITSSTSKLASDLLGQISGGLLPNIMGFANGVMMFFLGLILAYWLAVDYPRIFKELAIITGPERQEDVTLLFAVLSRSVGGYMKSVVITSVIDGVLSGFGFWLVGQPYAMLMGILTAVLHVIPVVGPIISAALATVTALTVSPFCAFWTLIMAVIAENITDNIIGPVVMRSTVSVHPAFSLLAIVVGSTLGGPVGMIISIPISAAIKGVFIYYFETRTHRQLVSYDGAIFQGTPFRHPDGSPAPSFDALDDDNFFATSRLIPEEDSKHLHVEAQKRPANSEVHISDLIRRHADEARTIFDRARDEQREDVAVANGEHVAPQSGPSSLPSSKASEADALIEDAEQDLRVRRRAAKRAKKQQDKSDKQQRKAKRLSEEPIIVDVDEDDIPNDQGELRSQALKKRQRDAAERSDDLS